MALQLAPTLLDSFDWLEKCPSSWRDRAFESLQSTLGRVWGGMTPAMQGGIDFENMLYKLASADNYDEIITSGKYSPNVLYCVERIHGFIFQKGVRWTINVDGVEYFFKCKLDAWSPEEVIDVKTTGNFRGNSQYLSKWQHRIYPLATGVKKFTYLVAEWEDLANSHKVKEIHEVQYILEDKDKVIGEITQRIREFIDFLGYDDELKKLYYTKYNRT